MCISICLAVLFCVLSLIHLYWAFGGRWAYFAAIPIKDNRLLFQPGMLACLFIATCLAMASSLVLMRSHLIQDRLPTPWTAYGVWGIAVIFLARAIGEFRYVGFFKRVTGTKFAQLDTYLYSPLCLLLSLGCTSINLL